MHKRRPVPATWQRGSVDSTGRVAIRPKARQRAIKLSETIRATGDAADRQSEVGVCGRWHGSWCNSGPRVRHIESTNALLAIKFDGFTWCQKTRKGKERRGRFNAIYSILHSPGGAVVYVNRYQEPAFFGASEADDDIQRYSRKIGESPRITRMPQRAGFPNGMLASWGKVELEPLDNDSIKALAEGRRPTTKGYFIDFIGNFARSAKEGLPVYRLSGGAGF